MGRSQIDFFDHASSYFALFKNNETFKQSSKQIRKSIFSSIVAGACVRAQVCMQAAEKSKSENLFIGKKLFRRVFFFFSHLPLLGKLPSPVLGVADSPSLVLCLTHHVLSYSTGTKEIQTSAVQHEIHKIFFPSVSRTQLPVSGLQRLSKRHAEALVWCPGEGGSSATWSHVGPNTAAASRPVGGNPKLQWLLKLMEKTCIDFHWAYSLPAFP